MPSRLTDVSTLEIAPIHVLPADVHVHRHSDAAAFLRRAEDWLLRAEAEHNLLLGLARQLKVSTAGYTAPLYLATLERGGEVVGCAFRTPPFKLGLTRMPEAALPALVRDLAGVYDWLPAALGPETETKTFAALWSAERGVQARPGMRQRIYQLDAVTWPARMPAGRMRPADADDVPLVTAWFDAFRTDTGLPGSAPRTMAEQHIARQSLFLWDDDGPTSMAGETARTRHGARVGYVYTPPEHRGRGYASACTAALSQRLLDDGLAFCFLYTDLSNPTSNSIYQRLGYYPVCDVIDYDFARPAR